jgi:transposase
MTEHCAKTCPIITEAVKSATTESRVAMALVAIEEEKISMRFAAERFGVPSATLHRKSPTVSSGTVGLSQPAPTKGKDGRPRKPPATKEEINRAWEMKDAGASTLVIAEELDRGKATVHNWFAKGREQSTLVPAKKQTQSFVLEKPAAVILEQQKEQLTPTGVLSDLTKEFIKKESKEFNRRIELLENAVELSKQLDKLWKYVQQKHDKYGRPVVRQDVEIASKVMIQTGAMANMAVTLGLPDDASYFDALFAIDALGKKISSCARQSIYLSGYSDTILP